MYRYIVKQSKKWNHTESPHEEIAVSNRIEVARWTTGLDCFCTSIVLCSFLCRIDDVILASVAFRKGSLEMFGEVSSYEHIRIE